MATKPMMNCRFALLIGLMLFASSVSHSESHVLEFVTQIGVGWQTDKFGWMSFVSFCPDGTMIASDGSTGPGDVSGNLTLWSFPEGRSLKSLPVRPAAISGDWKYYASYHGVGETESGKSLISLGDNVYAVHAFSPDSRYVAESARNDTSESHIRVVDLASGKQVSAFGKHDAFSIAISPDGVTLASGHWDIVTLWNIPTGNRLAVLRGFGRYVRSISFSKDGEVLAAGMIPGGFKSGTFATEKSSNRSTSGAARYHSQRSALMGGGSRWVYMELERCR